MTKIVARLANGSVLEMVTSEVEVRIGASPWGPDPDMHRRFMPGPAYWSLDGEPIDGIEGKKLLDEHVKAHQTQP